MTICYRAAAVLLAGLLFCCIFFEATAAASPLDCNEQDCAAVLPTATRFEAIEGVPYVAGFDSSDKPCGWVALSTDIVDVKAYSGQPLITLIGLDTEGTISGAQLVKHSEPILLVGIPVQELHDFIAFYQGKAATARVVVGTSSDKKALQVDIISGATVTALAQNQTILKTARTVGVEVGVVDISAARPGHFIIEETPWTWQQLVDEKVFGRLTVTEAQMGVPDPKGNFVDLWYTIADSPQIGMAILGKGTYRHLSEQLESNEHLFVVFGNGSNSFKGSAFVRGGIFDRVRIVQGLRELVFRDTDYENISRVRAEGAPAFKEGAVFISRGAQIDPGQKFEMVFLGSRYDKRTAYSREFREFKATHKLPSSVYVSEGGDLDEAMYVQAWRNRATDAVIVIVFLLLVIGVFSLRRWSTAHEGRLKAIHVVAMTFSVVVIGFYMHAQPSVTQLLTLVDSVVHEWRWELFASAPILFTLWIFTAFVSVIWGRGVFCGWVCPYGALTELINKVAIRLGIRQFEPSSQGIYGSLRYLIFIGLIPVFLYSPILGEKLAEIEPFKTTFLVSPWSRHIGFIAWWGFLLAISIVIYRPFCRFLCPLGAGLAIFGSFRFSGPRRRQFCSKCTICTKRCEPQAIRSDGTINPRDCLSCMECEANYRNDEVCPPLVALSRLDKKSRATTADEARRDRLQDEAKTQ